jgi:putative peptidoglycan lipid II flippase
VDITAGALVWVSLGMAGYAVQNILSRAYFARQDGRTPLLAGAVSIGVNIVLCMALVGPMKVAGLAIASAVSSTVYALLLLLPFQLRKESRVFDGRFWLDMVKMLLAAAVMAGAVWLLGGWLSGLLGPGKLGQLVVLGTGAVCGVAVYFAAALLLRVPETGLVLGIAKRMLKRG